MNDPRSPQSPSQPKKKPNSPFQPTFQPKSGSLDERVASLEATSKGLVEVVDTNASVLRDGLEITEARQWMIMKAFDDMISGHPRCAGTAPNITGIDWEHYKTEYLAFQEELQKQAEAAAPEEGVEEDPDAVVFGGGD